MSSPTTPEPYEDDGPPTPGENVNTMILRTNGLGPPDDYKEINFPGGMSNFDHEVEDGVEDRLRNERVFTHYGAWNFNGKVWWGSEGAFSCQVWVYGSPVATVRAASLEDLMRECSEEWGWD